MPESLLTLVLGFVSGVLSGMFGIGGGVVTTPAIRLLLGAPALVAVGTPLAAIVPSTLTGAWQYARSGEADVRSAVVMGLAGCLTAVAGAAVTRVAGGPAVLIVTAGIIAYMAVDMALQVLVPGDVAGRSGGSRSQTASARRRPRTVGLVACGAITGFYSGFLGLGGGFVLVPLLTRWMDYTMKRAVGTSLVSISILALPGLVTHALLGNIDVTIAAGLIMGVVPGAAVGARIALGTGERTLRLAFAALLVLAAAWLAISEVQGL